MKGSGIIIRGSSPIISGSAVDIFASGDMDDYFQFSVTSNRPLFTAIGNYLVMGKDATSGHSLDADDVLFGEDVEIDGILYADGAVIIAGDVTTAAKHAFGGVTDWGTGATGTVIDGSGYDWVTQTIGRINANLNNTAAAAAYHAITITANQTGSNSVFGTWTELYISNSVDLTGADNFASVWGQVEAGTNVTLSDTGCFTAGGYFNVKAGATLVVVSGHTVNGVRAQLEVAAITNAGRTAAFEGLKNGGVDWDYGIYLDDCGVGMALPGTITAGIDFGATTLTTDAARENSFIKCGTYTTQKTVNLSTDNHAYLFQSNILLTGTLTGSNKAILHYNKLQTDTAMTAGRLKVNENYVVVGAEVKDAHVIYGELFWKSGYTGVGVNNEGFGVAGTVDTTGAASAPSGLLYGGKFRIKGTLETGTYKHMALFVVSESSTHSNTVIENLGGATVTNMLWLKNEDTAANAINLSGVYTTLLNYTPGVDGDVNIVKINLTDTSLFWWDESNNKFVFEKGIRVEGVVDGNLGATISGGDIVCTSEVVARAFESLYDTSSYNMGTGRDGKVGYSIVDTDARSIHFGLPHVDEDGSNVACLVLLDYDAWGTDLGAGGIDLSSITQPSLVIGDEDSDSFIRFSFKDDDDAYITGGGSITGLEIGLRTTFAAPEVLDYADATIDGSGVIAVTKPWHEVIPNGGTGSANDDLSTATGGVKGQRLVLSAKTTANNGNDQITVKDGTGANTFVLAGGDFVLDHIDDRVELLHNGTEWVEMTRSSNS